jgi:hypothetical protein
MSNYSHSDRYSQAGNWLMGTARRNPEALLLLAAGCALLMRSSGSSSRTAARNYVDPQQAYGSNREGYRSRASASSVASEMGDGISRAAASASDYASDIKNKVSETAGSYTESVSQFAQDAGRNISEQTQRLGRQAQSTLQSGMSRVLRDQPLAVAVAGLAAGVAVAAAFPSTEVENRALGGAREALTEAASQAGENLMGAAGKAGERLQEAVAERGLTVEGLKDLAGDVASTFTNAVTGKKDDLASATIAPQGRTSERTRTAGFAANEPGGRSNR